MGFVLSIVRAAILVVAAIGVMGAAIHWQSPVLDHASDVWAGWGTQFSGIIGVSPMPDWGALALFHLALLLVVIIPSLLGIGHSEEVHATAFGNILIVLMAVLPYAAAFLLPHSEGAMAALMVSTLVLLLVGWVRQRGVMFIALLLVIVALAYDILGTNLFT